MHAYLTRARPVSCRGTLVNQACCDGTPASRCLVRACVVAAASFPLYIPAAHARCLMLAASSLLCLSARRSLVCVHCFPPDQCSTLEFKRAAMARH